MNALPKHRSAQAGRTWDRPWAASDFDPIQRYPRIPRQQQAAGVVLAIVIGIVGAVSLVHWWAS